MSFLPPNSTPANGLTEQSTQQPPSAESQSPSPQQHQQPRGVYPWSVHTLKLLPPTLLNNAPPYGPSPSPFPRYGHALPLTASDAGELFLFGGLVHESASNDLYVFSTRDLSTTLLETRGEIPSPRVGHAGALASDDLLIWGGDTSLNAPMDPPDNSLYLLNLGTLAFLVSIPTPAD